MVLKITDDIADQCGYIAWRPVGDGHDGVGLLRMYGKNYRLQLFDINGPRSNYCYHSMGAAVEALATWEPPADPTGWVKHIETDRCRIDGDPAKESIGWPLP